MNTQLPILLGNEVAVEQYATEINEQLASSTNAWRQVAEIFAAAQDQFGRQSKEMKQLGKKTNFSVAKVDKLTLIFDCKPLKNQHKLFSRVQTWTVLYQVTLLDDDQFATLCERLRNGENLTTGLVTSIRKSKVEEKRIEYQQFAKIMIDINAIRLGRLQQEEYETLIKTLEGVPYTKIEVNDLWSKVGEDWEKEIHAEYVRVVRSAWLQEKKKYLCRIRGNDGNKEYYKSRVNEIRDDVIPFLDNGEFKIAFDNIDSDEFDEGRFWNEAEGIVAARHKEKYGELLSEPFPDTETNFRIID